MQGAAIAHRVVFSQIVLALIFFIDDCAAFGYEYTAIETP